MKACYIENSFHDNQNFLLKRSFMNITYTVGKLTAQLLWLELQCQFFVTSALTSPFEKQWFYAVSIFLLDFPNVLHHF